jgi:hypothetical protein
MSELEKKKYNIVAQLRGLCAHCSTGSSRDHRCPVQEISARISALRGVPLIVNNEFKGVLWSRM